MKNFKNFTGILSALIVLFIGLGCCGSSITTSHKDACVTPDGSRIGVIDWSGRTALIDTKSGKILSSADDESASGAVVCSGNNEVISIYNKFAQWLTSDKRIERTHTNGKTIGITGDGKLVSYTGGRSSSSDNDWGAPLEFYLTDIGNTSKDIKPTVVPLEKFEGVRKNARSYYILPVRLISSDELLIVAGAVPASYQYGEGIETKVSPEPWGFYLLNPQNGNIRPYGSTRTGDTEINFIDAPRAYSTSDGKFLALISGFHIGNAVVIFDAKTDKEIFRQRMPDEYEITDVILSEDGSQTAVAVKHYKKMRNGTSADYKVKIYDLRRKEEVKEFSIKNNTPYLIDFRGNELIINHYSDSISKLNTETGQTILEIKFPEQK